MKSYITLLLLCVFGFSAYAQHDKLENVLLVRINFLHKQYKQYRQAEDYESFVMIHKHLIDEFVIDTTYNENPCIAYQLTGNKGYCAIEREDIYTYTCCKSGNVPDNIYTVIAAQNEINFSNYRYKKLLDRQKLKQGKTLEFESNAKETPGKYIITIWEAKVEYCVCVPHENWAGQRVYGNKAAYLLNIHGLWNTDKETIKILDNFFEKCIGYIK